MKRPLGTIRLLLWMLLALFAVRAGTSEPPLLSAQETERNIFTVAGKITLLRVHDVGTGFGPPGDAIDVEVVVRLDQFPDRSFGFQLRPDSHEGARRGMLDVFRHAFNEHQTIRLDFVDSGGKNATLIRATLLPSYDLFIPLVQR